MSDDQERDRRREKMRALGQLGGRATYAKYGRAHMQRIGLRGFTRALQRSMYSDAGHMIEHFVALGRFKKLRKEDRPGRIGSDYLDDGKETRRP